MYYEYAEKVVKNEMKEILQEDLKRREKKIQILNDSTERHRNKLICLKEQLNGEIKELEKEKFKISLIKTQLSLLN